MLLLLLEPLQWVDQFRALFGASRVPKSHSSDTIAVYENSNHVAVMCCNQLFYFQALWPDGDVAVDEGDLVDILDAIWVHAHRMETDSDKKEVQYVGNRRKSSEINKKKGHDADLEEMKEGEQHYLNSVSAFGVLTSLCRKQWAQAREEMIKDSPTKNANSFKIVDSALFVLVLDDCAPKDKHEAASNMLHGSYELSEWRTENDAYTTEYQVGSCTNRWYDKLQVSTRTKPHH